MDEDEIIAMEARLDELVDKELRVTNTFDRRNGDPQVFWAIEGELKRHANRVDAYPAFYNVEKGSGGLSETRGTIVVFTAEHVLELDTDHLRLELE